jgi:hypothetical protein
METWSPSQPQRSKSWRLWRQQGQEINDSPLLWKLSTGLSYENKGLPFLHKQNTLSLLKRVVPPLLWDEEPKWRNPANVCCTSQSGQGPQTGPETKETRIGQGAGCNSSWVLGKIYIVVDIDQDLKLLTKDRPSVSSEGTPTFMTDTVSVKTDWKIYEPQEGLVIKTDWLAASCNINRIVLYPADGGSRFLRNVCIFFLYGAAAHIGPWPPLMRFLNLTLIDSW